MFMNLNNKLGSPWNSGIILKYCLLSAKTAETAIIKSYTKLFKQKIEMEIEFFQIIFTPNQNLNV